MGNLGDMDIEGDTIKEIDDVLYKRCSTPPLSDSTVETPVEAPAPTKQHKRRSKSNKDPKEIKKDYYQEHKEDRKKYYQANKTKILERSKTNYNKQTTEQKHKKNEAQRQKYYLKKHGTMDGFKPKEIVTTSN